MNSRQMLLFRHVLKTTGCLAAAFRAAGARPEAARRLRRAPAAQTAPSAPWPPVEAAGADLERAVAALESEAVRRALSGVSLPVYHQGRECGSTVKHSDQLLMFLLKTLKPGRYAGVKEPQALRPVVLDIDLSAGTDDPADADEDAPAAGAAGADWS